MHKLGLPHYISTPVIHAEQVEHGYSMTCAAMRRGYVAVGVRIIDKMLHIFTLGLQVCMHLE